jgi:hypothetical protein
VSWRSIELRIDRQSTSMGDDVQSHERVATVPRTTLLSAAIEQASPEIKARGWSWVAVVDAETVAVWSIDHGVQLLVPDRRLWRGPVEILFRYFNQIDPGWLFERLSHGTRANLRELEKEYAPIAREKYFAELRRREREIHDRLLSVECVEAIEAFGGQITLHADIACDFTHLGEGWSLRRTDTMLNVFVGRRAPIASIRPHALGEAWLVGMLAASTRAEAGLTDLPDVEPSPGLELTRKNGRWESDGETVLLLKSDLGARVARLVHGRSSAEVRELLAPGP